MAFAPLLKELFAVLRYPSEDIRFQTGRPATAAFQIGQIDNDIDVATDQVNVRRTMIALAELKPIFVAKTLFGRQNYETLPLDGTTRTSPFRNLKLAEIV